MADFGTGGGGGDWILVEEKTAGSNCTNLNFDTTVTADSTDDYRMECDIINNNAGAISIYLYLNSTQVGGDRQYLLASHNVISGARGTATPNSIGSITTQDSHAYLEVNLPFLTSGKDRGIISRMTESLNAGGISIFDINLNITTPATGTAITTIGISTATANGIKAGTKMRLWRRSN